MKTNKPVTFLDLYNSKLKPHHSGIDGRFRDDVNQCLIAPDNKNIVLDDEFAIEAFLKQHASSPLTFTQYAREIERLRLWSIIIKDLPLSSLNTNQIEEFIEFLKKPPASWIAESRSRKWSENWRPFVKTAAGGGQQLSPNAIKVALAALDSLFTWWCDVGYSRRNPFSTVRGKAKKAGRIKEDADSKVERYLNENMWSAVTQVIDEMPAAEPKELIEKQRATFILSFMYLLGPRVQELSDATMRDFRRKNGFWFWHVPKGKGSKKGDVALPPEMFERLMAWRTCLNLPGNPKSTEGMAVLPKLNKFGVPVFTSGSGITPRRINQILKSIFEAAAKRPGLTPDESENLVRASAHWMRHTAITSKVNAGMDIVKVKNDARHSDLKTTMRYVHSTDDERSEEARKHKTNWNIQPEEE